MDFRKILVLIGFTFGLQINLILIKPKNYGIQSSAIRGFNRSKKRNF